ncbi:hypothetical protein [Paracoccus sp. (in: a-proteobacteria)]|uniref:hypothetical protein n=1 Tax=Paracoccus sp. TaxID=267 RepID=UPI0028AB7781|nr:hypothetical protein [Paracoccus sp. (in: a-proteobacteria)]
MRLIGNVLAVEPEGSIEAHVHRYLAYRFEGHAVLDLAARDADEEAWVATMRSPDDQQSEITLRAQLIEDDQFLAFDIIDQAS